jgi:hypothetical protein
MAIDPSWLPSTATQSSAALVAIVGGFLINRLVGIESDRGQSELRLNEARDRLKQARSHEAERRTAYVTARAEQWLSRYDAVDLLAKAVLAGVHDIDVSKVREQIDGYPDDVAESEMTPIIDGIVATVVDAREAIFDLVPESAKDDELDWRSFRRRHGMGRERWDEYRQEVFETIAEEKAQALREREAEEKRREEEERIAAMPADQRLRVKMNRLVSSQLDLGPTQGVLAALTALSEPSFDARQLATAVRQDAIPAGLYERWDESRAAVTAAQFEVDASERALRRTVRQPGVFFALLVLTAFSVAGIVVPMIALSREHTDPASMKLAVTVCFMVGVALFLGYMWFYALRLGQVGTPKAAWRRHKAKKGTRPPATENDSTETVAGVAGATETIATERRSDEAGSA